MRRLPACFAARLAEQRSAVSRSGRAATAQGLELRALRQLKREMKPAPYLFTTERSGPMTTAGLRGAVAMC
jgi:hypothetical protein